MTTALRLLARGDEVVGLDNLNDYYECAAQADRLARCSPSRGSASSSWTWPTARAWPSCLPNRSFDRVIHLAAQAGVRYSLQNPHAYVDSNVVGFMNVLEGCRHGEVQHLVYASSSSVYGGNTAMPFSEHDSVDHPVSMYAATKKANELMAHTYSHLFGLPTTGCASSPSTGPGAGRTWRCSCSPRPSSKGGRSTSSTTAACSATSPMSTTSSKAWSAWLDRVATADPDYDPTSPDPGTSNAPYRVFNIGNHNPVPLLDFIGHRERPGPQGAEEPAAAAGRRRAGHLRRRRYSSSAEPAPWIRTTRSMRALASLISGRTWAQVTSELPLPTTKPVPENLKRGSCRAPWLPTGSTECLAEATRSTRLAADATGLSKAPSSRRRRRSSEAGADENHGPMPPTIPPPGSRREVARLRSSRPPRRPKTGLVNLSRSESWSGGQPLKPGVVTGLAGSEHLL
jgi:UDP-glucuronate 4-epimerase